MKKIRLFALMLCFMVVFLPSLAYAGNDTQTDFNDDYILSTQQYLLEKGFSEDEVNDLGNDIFQVANLIKTEDMDAKEIEQLKNGFLYSPTLFSDGEQTSYDVDENGIVTFGGGNQTVVPNRNNVLQESTDSFARVDPGSTGPHAITYTLPSYQFFETTGFAELPQCNISGSGQGGSGSGNINSRPYMMFGAYQKLSPYAGCDAGLVYYKEYGGWVLFINTGGENGWNMNKKTVNGVDVPARVMTQNKVYLDMKLTNGGVEVIARDPSSWVEIDRLYASINSSFNERPSNIELTREVAMAQFARRNNGDSLTGAHWSQVYLYSTAQKITDLSVAKYLQSSHPKRYQYSSSLTRFLIGDVRDEISYISISPIANYHEEKISIKLND